MALKILMFGWEFPPHNSGGLGTACLGLTRALAKEGAEVTFVLPKKTPVSADHLKMVFADVCSVNLRRVNSNLVPYITSGKYSRFYRGDSVYGKDLISEVLRYASVAGQIAREEDFDVIYAHDWLSFGAGLVAKEISGKPLVVQVHATEFDRCGGPYGVNQEVYEMEKEGMEKSDRIIAVSNLTKCIITKYYGIDENKIDVVHNGIDDDTLVKKGGEVSRLQALKDAGNKIVLFLGRITLQKGPDYFVKAAKRVLDYNKNVVFVMSGSGDMEHQVMELASGLGIGDKVLFTGFLRGAEQHEAYSTADLFVMPSVSEPFGITPLEAMKIGTPVLISKQSGVSEVVNHALKVDFWDVDEIANKILSVVGHPALGETLRQNAHKEVSSITWAKAAKKIKELLKSLLKSNL